MFNDHLATRLRHNAEVFRGLVAGVSETQARWKPTAEKWSILEVVNHLVDEERDDFRQRLDLILHHAGDSWPGNDPQRWCVERKYNERELEESMERFLEERRSSLEWLKRLGAPDWELAYEHPEAGILRAGDLLVSWLEHDFLHARQLIGLHRDYARLEGASFSTRYAGEW